MYCGWTESVCYFWYNQLAENYLEIGALNSPIVSDRPQMRLPVGIDPWKGRLISFNNLHLNIELFLFLRRPYTVEEKQTLVWVGFVLTLIFMRWKRCLVLIYSTGGIWPAFSVHLIRACGCTCKLVRERWPPVVSLCLDQSIRETHQLVSRPGQGARMIGKQLYVFYDTCVLNLNLQDVFKNNKW